MSISRTRFYGEEVIYFHKRLPWRMDRNGSNNVSLVGPNSHRSSGNGSVEFSVADVSGNSQFIEASTNLVIWSVLTNLLPSVEVVRFVDPDSPAYQYRFYRCNR
jgi:hypothetical protein